MKGMYRFSLREFIFQCSCLCFVPRTVRANERLKPSITPSTEKGSTTNDNGSSTDEAESEGNNR